MKYWMFAGTITLTGFAVLSIVVSMIVSAAAPVAAERLQRYSAASRAALLFAMRMLPVTIAACAAFGVALPVFLRYEPRTTDEPLARTLLLFGACGAAMVAGGVYRAVRALKTTNAVARAWRLAARPLDGFEAPVPAFAIEASFPTVAVVGVTRPALFIAERVLRECSDEEVRAMVLHECAHVSTRDNLKRLAIRACPDLVGAGGALDRAWASAAEEAADAAAVSRRPAAALELAQALIRLARLAAEPRTPELASAFYLGGSIEARVRRLVDPSAAPDAYGPLACRMLIGTGLATLAALSLAAPHLHQAMEALVRHLP